MSHEGEPDPMTLPTDRRAMRWWQDWKWVAAIAAVIFALASSTVAIAQYQTANTVDQTQPIVQNLQNIATSNQETLRQLGDAVSHIDQNQRGIDELVAFVHDLEAQAVSGPNSATAQVVATIESLICTSQDPVRQAACAQLGVRPVGG